MEVKREEINPQPIEEILPPKYEPSSFEVDNSQRSRHKQLLVSQEQYLANIYVTLNKIGLVLEEIRDEVKRGNK